MKKIPFVNYIGARPQIIKAAALSRTLRENFSDVFREIVVHSGQHYDRELSGVFLEQLEVGEPHHRLDVEKNDPSRQMGQMIAQSAALFQKYQPAFVVVYGDTNSTLAGALAADICRVPVVHIEAGLRSRRKDMPEERNRCLVDHLASVLFCPDAAAVNNLRNEGITHNESDFPKVIESGDIMLDNLRYLSTAKEKHAFTSEETLLLTVHRNFNTDDPERLDRILRNTAIFAETHGLQVVFPLHPRTRQALKNRPSVMAGIDDSLFRITESLDYKGLLRELRCCRFVFTDSGGLQKEAAFFGKPVFILRPETEWKGLVEHGMARLVDDQFLLMEEAFAHFVKNPPSYVPLYGDGRAAEKICAHLQEYYTL